MAKEAIEGASDSNDSTGGDRGPRREIPGNLPYLNASGTIKSVLDKIIEAQRPDRFSADYLENVLKLKGGSPRATIPILKRMGFLSGDGTPTELYAKFKTEGGRANAAFQGLRNAYAEIFKRSEYAHAADENKLRDIIVEITGLEKGHKVATAIKGTFNAIRSYVPKDFSPSGLASADLDKPKDEKPSKQDVDDSNSSPSEIRLAYNINVVLPETSDLAVLNAIFRSIKENLLR